MAVQIKRLSLSCYCLATVWCGGNRLRPADLLFWRVAAACLFAILLFAGSWGWRTNAALAEERAMRLLLQNKF